LYKTCRPLAADQALLDIMQIAFDLQPMKASHHASRAVLPNCPPCDCDVINWPLMWYRRKQIAISKCYYRK